MEQRYIMTREEPVLYKDDRVWFEGDKKPFKVRCANGSFAICTKPYNFKPHTVIYTIIDFQRGVRGMDNMVFSCHDYYSDEDCEMALEELISGKMEVSYKHSKYVKLDIVRID